MKRMTGIFLTVLLVLTMVPSFNVFAAVGDVSYPAVVAANDWNGNPSWQSVTMTETATAGTYTLTDNTAMYSLTWTPSTNTISIAATPKTLMVIPSSIGGIAVLNVGSLALSTAKNYTTTYIVVSEGVTTLVSSAFVNNKALVGIKLPSTLTTIGTNCFMSVTTLAQINLQDTKVNSIGTTAFKQTALVNVIFPTTLTTIQRETFSTCGSLVSVTFLGNLVNCNGVHSTTNNQAAFLSTPKLNTIIFKGTPASTTVSGFQEAGTDNLVTVYYPQGGSGYTTTAFIAGFRTGTTFTAVAAADTNSVITSFTSIANGYNVQTNIGLNAGIATSKNYIALFDANNNLIAVQSVVTGVKSTDFVTSDTTATKAKIFVLDGLANMKPLCASSELAKS